MLFNSHLNYASICQFANMISSVTVQGLMTPIIRNADEKTLTAISSEVRIFLALVQPLFFVSLFSWLLEGLGGTRCWFVSPFLLVWG